MNWLGWILVLGSIFLTVLLFLFAGLGLVTKSWGTLFIICAIACATISFFTYWILKTQNKNPRQTPGEAQCLKRL